MEVHHHSHSSRQKWTHYIWEFLMLFFAVTLGFFVENQREHYIEHQREKQFIKSLAEDIQNDKENMDFTIAEFTLIRNHIDSLIPLLKDNSNMEENAANIYRHAVWIHGYSKLTYFDRTIEQLKNSGNFRLIRNEAVSKSIMEYDGAMINNALDMQNNYVFQRKEKLIDQSNNIFKVSAIRKWFIQYRGGMKIELPAPPYFITTEKAVINRLINELEQYGLTISWFMKSLNEWIIPKAIELDKLIKKEYHLK